MKTIIKIAFISLLALNATTGSASNARARNIDSKATIGQTRSLTQDEANALVKRVYEIRTMDLNSLSSSEKRDLKNELQSIKQRLSDPLAGGIYISAGALILILILLIILF